MQDFAPVISDQINFITDFLHLVEQLNTEISKKPELLKNSVPWYGYYQLSLSEHLNIVTIIIGEHENMLKYIFSDDPTNTILDLWKQNDPAKPTGDYDLSDIFGLIYSFAKSYESLLYNRQTLHRMHKKILECAENKDSLLMDMIQIDKTIMSSSIFQERLKLAQIENDENFFRQIANALNPRTPPQHMKDSTLLFIVFFLCDAGEIQFWSEKQRLEHLSPFNTTKISDESFLRKVREFINLY